MSVEFLIPGPVCWFQNTLVPVEAGQAAASQQHSKVNTSLKASSDGDFPNLSPAKICFCVARLNESHVCIPLQTDSDWLSIYLTIPWVGLWSGWRRHPLPRFSLVQIC